MPCSIIRPFVLQPHRPVVLGCTPISSSIVIINACFSEIFFLCVDVWSDHSQKFSQSAKYAWNCLMTDCNLEF